MNVQFPIGKLTVPEQVTKEDVNEWLAQIETFANRLSETVNHLSEEQMNYMYRENSYTVLQLVHHITDSQLNMFQRLKLALTDDNPIVPPFDQDKWAIQPDTKLPASISIDILTGLNKRIVHLGKELTNEQLQRVFTLQNSGEISVATKLAKLTWHEEHHLKHIEIALSKKAKH